MRFLIVTTAAEGSTLGNRVTADRWADHLTTLGHTSKIGSTVSTSEASSDEPIDCLIALHANSSHDAIVGFRKRFPDRPIVVMITGTDIHVDLPGGGQPADRVRNSLSIADRIVTLEPRCVELLEPAFKAKARTILQSAVPIVENRSVGAQTTSSDRFCISVVGHLRAVKDPLAAAEAARLLPAESKIQIEQWGAAKSQRWSDRANEEMRTNPRYRWLGPLDYRVSQLKLAKSDAMVISSLAEGAPSVISEAIVNDVPVLANKITATIGLLGEDYPGFYAGGNRQQLANLLWQTESDHKFLDSLHRCGQALQPNFAPEIERERIRSLVDSI